MDTSTRILIQVCMMHLNRPLVKFLRDLRTADIAAPFITEPPHVGDDIVEQYEAHRFRRRQGVFEFEPLPFDPEADHNVTEIDKAHLLLEPLLGSSIAPVLFGIALLCSGLNSTVTATMAGQIVMEGFVRLKLQPWLRRLITRGFAILPATVVILIYGTEGTGQWLSLSQVVLSFQLPFAIVPLVMFTASRAKMGPMVSPRWLTSLCALIAVTIIMLNVNLLATVLG